MRTSNYTAAVAWCRSDSEWDASANKPAYHPAPAFFTVDWKDAKGASAQSATGKFNTALVTTHAITMTVGDTRRPL